MRYVNVRSKIQDGDVLLFRGARGRIASAIRWGTRSRYSHAGLALWVRDRLMVAESREFRGCRLVPLSRAVKGSHVDSYMLLPQVDADLDRSRITEEALRRLGEPYGWLSIARHAVARLPLIALMRAAGVLKRVWLIGRLIPARNYSEDDMADPGNAVVCSTYVALCYRAGGVDLVHNLADRDTTPGDIARTGILLLRGELQP